MGALRAHLLVPFPGGTKNGFLGAERDEARRDAPVAIDVVSHRPGDQGRQSAAPASLGDVAALSLRLYSRCHRDGGGCRSVTVLAGSRRAPATWPGHAPAGRRYTVVHDVVPAQPVVTAHLVRG